MEDPYYKKGEAIVEIIEVNDSHADIVGKVHSTAWKDTYREIFSTEYINQDTPEKRKQECIGALENKRSRYYLLFVQNVAIGIIKISFQPKNICEIQSIYFLKEYRANGYGSQAINFIKKEYSNYKIILWVLEQNHSAIRFYERNGFKFTTQKRIVKRGSDYFQIQFACHN